MPPSLTRRSLLQYSAAAIATAGVAAGGYWLAKPRIRLGLIGSGTRGTQLARALRLMKPLHHVHGDIVAIADVDRPNAERTRAQEWPRAELYEDYRALLARDDVEAVFVATPDHWHAAVSLEALRAGKAVYCEKPLAVTVDEGQRLVRAVRESGLTFQFGNIQRSDGRFRLACELVRNGRIGSLRQVTVSLNDIGVPRGPFAPTPVPSGLNWDFFCGSAPLQEYSPERRAYWTYFWENGGGEMANWGIHHMDIVHWAMAEAADPVAIEARGTTPIDEQGCSVPAGFTADLEYSNGVQVHVDTSSTSRGILFEGDQGRIYVSRSRLSGKPVEDLASRPLPVDAIRVHDRPLPYGSWQGVRWPSFRHIHEFLHCIRTGAAPATSIESAHRSTTACHLVNIAMRLGRPLRWDPSAERFIDSSEADSLLSRSYRPPYLLEPPASA
jgi:predicted dehydrogenase